MGGGGWGVIWLESPHLAFILHHTASVGELGSSLELRLDKFLAVVLNPEYWDQNAGVGIILECYTWTNK